MLLSFYGYSQQTYLATYKLGVYKGNDIKQKLENQRLTELMAKVGKAMEDITFELYFNQFSSSFQRKEVLIPAGQELVYNLASSAGALKGELYYKNIKTKTKLLSTEVGGQNFLVEYPFEQFDWTITNDVKNILGYKCYRATSRWEEYDYSRKMLITSNPEVWFTNDIPNPFGPSGLDGLPGLVLEASTNGKTYLYITDIQISSEINSKILNEPNKGKKILRKDFVKLVGESSPIRR